MKKVWLVVLLGVGLVMSLTGVAQTQVTQEWVNLYNGSPRYDGAYAIALDAYGNSYVTGWIENPPIDFEIVTIKYDTYGNQKWVMFYDGGLGWDVGRDIVVDEQGFVYVTGNTYRKRDDGIVSMDVVTIKYDPLTGQQLWIKFYDGGVTGTNNVKDDSGVDMAVDGQFVYVAAWSFGETGIPPQTTNKDYATIKYDRSSGSQIWVARYNGPGSNGIGGEDSPVDIVVDPSGNVYVTGYSDNGVTNSDDYVTIKYDQNGQNPQKATWNSGNGKDWPYAMALDGLGNVYVTGGSGLQGYEDNPTRKFDLTTVKYSTSDMGQVWYNTYGDLNKTERGRDIVASGTNIYVTGEIPDPNRTDTDIGTLKYNPNPPGNPIWVRYHDGGMQRDDMGRALTLDGSGYVYVTGTIETAVSPNTDQNYATLKYSSDGNEIWHIEYDGPWQGNGSYDNPIDIALDLAGSVYVTGTSLVDPSENNSALATVKYNQGFIGFQTEPSQGRHLVRDPLTGYLHLVMKRTDNKVYYTKSTNNGTSWDALTYLGDGQYPTVCMAVSILDFPVISVAYKPTTSNNSLIYRYFDTGTGQWSTPASLNIGNNSNPGPPSIVSDGSTVTVVYRAFVAGSWRVQSKRFPYSNPGSAATQNIDATGSPEQPCVAVDGAGDVHAAWRRTTGVNYADEIYYSKRVSGSWQTPAKVYSSSGYLSTQPFVECFGDSVYVVWSEAQTTPPNLTDVMRARRRNVVPPPAWDVYNVSASGSIASESPTQAWKEITTWSEWSPGPQPDINYWRQNGEIGAVVSNPAEWSYWTHSQMRYPDPDQFTHLWSAWTERDNATPANYRVLTSHRGFWPISFGPGAGAEMSDYGDYYKVLAGQDTPSVYCKKRDGVLRYADKAVDFARDSLVYELPYLDPVYDYYLRISSYRETGNGWVQALSVNGGASRTVRFAPNVVDTAWVRIPPEAYAQDRKVTFALRNVQGDYVTNFGLTLFQRDPKPRGKGGPQTGELVVLPFREVFAVYPNPTRGQARIDYSLKAPEKVRLAIYDVTGRLVREVVNGVQPAGVHRASWDGKSASGQQASSGIYFVKLSLPGVNKMSRFVVVR